MIFVYDKSIIDIENIKNSYFIVVLFICKGIEFFVIYGIYLGVFL